MIRFILFLIAASQLLSAQNNTTAQYTCSHQLNHPCFKHGETAKMQAANSRSDTIDIIHYDIQLTVTNFTAQAISGQTLITLTPKIPDITQVLLDLQNMNVSNVTINDADVAFEYNSPLLRVFLPEPSSPGDTLFLGVSYNGNPITASFGGFYFTSTYAYNLGVGIGVDPPNFGRVWFPCFDNFVERSTFSCHITTAANHKAFCGGLLTGTTTNPDATKTWHWELSQSIPTYLASVAVSDYATIAYTHPGVNAPIPVQLGARAGDTVNLKNSFIHLPDCISAFEDAWGPYRFDRVGFVVVPFNGGAMEHAANIAYPLFAVNGNLQWESLMAHEFSHHWWGDLVTCETASDMWINEGWASYNESLFSEYVYGRERYKTDIRTTHKDVVLYAHVRDGDYLPVSGVPFDATYGSHVYSKGGDMVHTLRSYMGDSLFFHCTKAFLNAYSFNHVNSIQLRDYLSTCSGIDLNPFFQNWIFNPGFPHFSIDSLQVQIDETGSNYLTSVYVRQRLYAAPDFYTQVPLEITFFDYALNSQTVTMQVNGACSGQQFSLPFYPVLAVADMEERLSDATIDQFSIVDTPGLIDFADAGVKIDIADVSGQTFIRATNNMVMPDRLQTPITNLILHPDRFWTIEGYNTGGLLNASIEFTYNGSNSTTGGYLDHNLISVSETNLRLLYRPTSAVEWQILTSATLLAGGSNSDKRGSMRINTLQFGEYALGIIDPARTDTLTTYQPDCITVSVPNLPQTPRPDSVFTAYPNPAAGKVTVVFTKILETTHQLRLYSMEGKLLQSVTVAPNTPSVLFETSNLPSGSYVLQLYNPTTKTKIGEQKLSIIR